MLLVLQPAGVLVNADITHQAAYLAQLRAAGVTDIRVDDGGLASAVIGALSGNTFRPQAIIARKAASGRTPYKTGHLATRALARPGPGSARRSRQPRALRSPVNV